MSDEEIIQPLPPLYTGPRTGRFLATLDWLPQNWREIVRQCGDSGQTFATMRIRLGIGRASWNRLLKEYEEFAEIVDDAKERSEHWWFERGRAMAMGADGNATVWIFAMKNQFGWRDRADLNVSGTIGVNKVTRRIIKAGDQQTRVLDQQGNQVPDDDSGN